jgi:hypothetical protein
MSWTDTIYYYMGYVEEDVSPSPKTVQQRHMVMEQIRKSKMRLTPTIVNIHKLPIKPKSVSFKKGIMSKRKYKLIKTK